MLLTYLKRQVFLVVESLKLLLAEYKRNYIINLKRQVFLVAE